MRKSLPVILVLLIGAGVLLVVLLSPKPPSSPDSNLPAAAPAEPVPEPRPDFPEPPPGAVVFDMHYEGLTGADDKLAYHAFYGYGKIGDDNTPFIEAVREKVGDVKTVRNPNLGLAQWSALETRDDKPIAFYFDLNADGCLSEDERILPETATSNFTYFYTPDFLIHKDDGRLVPFRTFLRVRGSGASCMWSPACVLKGSAEIAGEPATLVLFGKSFAGSFTDYGGSSFMLIAAKDKERRHSRYGLSRLACIGNEFYRLTAHGSHEKGRTVRVVLEKDTRPRGELAVAVAGQSEVKAQWGGGTIVGANGTDIQFSISEKQTSLPAGRYRLGRGYVECLTEGLPVWRIDFKDGPGFAIEAGRTCTVQLGRPELLISAVNARKRYNSDAKEESVFAKGIAIYLAPKIKGQAGEIFARFSQLGADRRQMDVEPTVRILDPDGKEIVAEKMRYG